MCTSGPSCHGPCLSAATACCWNSKGSENPRVQQAWSAWSFSPAYIFYSGQGENSVLCSWLWHVKLEKYIHTFQDIIKIIAIKNKKKCLWRRTVNKFGVDMCLTSNFLCRFQSLKIGSVRCLEKQHWNPTAKMQGSRKTAFKLGFTNLFSMSLNV